jgi:hypothetical protein
MTLTPFTPSSSRQAGSNYAMMGVSTTVQEAANYGTWIKTFIVIANKIIYI